jgi:hypothetical protein
MQMSAPSQFEPELYGEEKVTALTLLRPFRSRLEMMASRAALSAVKRSSIRARACGQLSCFSDETPRP